MLLFFVTIGAAAGSLGALLQTGWLAGFIMLQLGVHMAFTLGVGRLFHLPMEVRYTRSITRTCHIGMCVGWPIYAEGVALLWETPVWSCWIAHHYPGSYCGVFNADEIYGGLGWPCESCISIRLSGCAHEAGGEH